MSGSINKVILVGRLGQDPEVSNTSDGRKFCRFSLATSEQWTNRQSGERQERTEWHRVVVFNENIAKVAEQYLRKGSLIYIEGQLQTRKWQDNEGKDRYSTEVVLQNFNATMKMLGGRGDNAGDSAPIANNSGESEQAAAAGEPPPPPPSPPTGNDIDDDIPF